MEMEAIVGIPFVKGNAENRRRPTGLKKTGISWIRRVISEGEQGKKKRSGI